MVPDRPRALSRAAEERRGLVGDEDLIRRAMLDEAERQTFRATPPGPSVVADLDDAKAALIQLSSYFDLHPTAKFLSRSEPWENGLHFARLCVVEGDPPVLHCPIPPGAVA